MTSKQRAYLKGLAMNIDPVFQIGKSSLTPEITQAVDEALEARELIKVTVLKIVWTTAVPSRMSLQSAHTHRWYRSLAGKSFFTVLPKRKRNVRLCCRRNRQAGIR